MSKKGTLSIHSENIFPIIKKWLYSDHDIFIRELISNASDAILKFKKLCDMGETSDTLETPFQITVTLDKVARTITISDNGLGMTEDEIEKYITQIAFSGAEDFLNQYKDKLDNEQIIGHFGLGFYSSFMVASTVDIHTQSYKDAPPVNWSCDGGTSYETTEGTRTSRGTDIILHVSEDGEKFLKMSTLFSIIRKYCSFMPVPIYLINADPLDTEEDEDLSELKTGESADESANEGSSEDSTESTDESTGESTGESTDESAGESSDESTGESSDESSEEPAEDEPYVPRPLNDPFPLYAKNPSECTDKEYKDFYGRTFTELHSPLFWIHLNMEYPFKLKGILYFPKLKNEFEMAEGKIKLYNNQVFVADNIKEVIPEFLLLLKGVIDCPDIPLNVSRSFLQNDGFVSKISDYIVKKVADKLISLYKNDTVNYEKFWDSIAPFIKYGCLKDDKFFNKMNDYVLYKTTNNNYMTLPSYLHSVEETNKNHVVYISDADQQSQYVKIFKENDILAVYLAHQIDAPFMSHVESKNSAIKFMRVDSDLSTALQGGAIDTNKEQFLTNLFTIVLQKPHIKLSIQNLKSNNVASMLLVSEEARRMKDMIKMYGMDKRNIPPTEETLVLNQNHPLINALTNEALDAGTKVLICNHLYDLAVIANQPLSADAMQEFINRNNDLMLRILR
ncbi:MAG: molecular chaperone HtpG [Cellulosilyticaceae bacterium]